MTVVAVEPADLRSAAARVRSVAESLARSVASRGGGLVAAGESSWRAAAHLRVAARAWTDHLNDLAAGLEQLAVDLGALAETMVAADRAAACWRVGVAT
jgi:hypothetical protein